MPPYDDDECGRVQRGQEEQGEGEGGQDQGAQEVLQQVRQGRRWGAQQTGVDGNHEREWSRNVNVRKTIGISKLHEG